MTWEEDTIVKRLLLQLLDPRATVKAQRDNDARRNRSDRIRYFLTAFSATHWAERV